MACANTCGWDHHFGENVKLPGMLFEFGSALAAFRRNLGDRMESVTVVALSEFGRAARENAHRGTDHGDGNVMFVMGGGVRGGKVYGRWPGLGPDRLHEAHSLAVTTDFRDVLGEFASQRLRARNLQHVLAGNNGGRERPVGLFKS